MSKKVESEYIDWGIVESEVWFVEQGKIIAFAVVGFTMGNDVGTVSYRDHYHGQVPIVVLSRG